MNINVASHMDPLKPVDQVSHKPSSIAVARSHFDSQKEYHRPI